MDFVHSLANSSLDWVIRAGVLVIWSTEKVLMDLEKMWEDFLRASERRV